VFVTPNRRHPIVALFAVCLHPRIRSLVARVTDGRPSERIFLTHYKANTLGDLAHLIAGADLEAVELQSFSSYPMTFRIPVLRNVENAWLWASRGHWADSIRSNLIGVCRRSSHAGPADLQPSAGPARGTLASGRH